MSEDSPQSPLLRPARRRAGALAGVLLVAVAAGVIIALTDPFAASGKAGGTQDNASPTALATVTQRPLSSQQDENGTLGYAGEYSVVNEAAGTITHLPSVGQVIAPGHVLYGISGSPVVLMAGTVPTYRTLSEGMEGRDVAELNRDLRRLGYATSEEIEPGSDYFGAGTTYALERLQKKLGTEQTGTLKLGEAIFLPGRLRITKLEGALGTQAQAGAPIIEASSTRRQVVVQLDAASQGGVHAGDRVSITMPSGRVTQGRVSSVGKVATSGSSNPGEPEGPPTIEVQIRPLHPKATGSLDQAPVHVSITTASVRSALVVPVNSLLALAGGGYALEVAEGHTHRLLGVSLGIFDDAVGLVQVSGTGLRAGQQIVVPAE